MDEECSRNNLRLLGHQVTARVFYKAQRKVGEIANGLFRNPGMVDSMWDNRFRNQGIRT